MKNKITELNNLYKSVLENIEHIRRILGSHCVNHALGFYNNHSIRIEDKFEKEIYPIPVISCELGNLKTDIGLDLATDEKYIGFIELTLTKDEILAFTFESLDGFKFEIYGFYYYEEDFYFGDINQAKKIIQNSKETKFHININISSLNQIEVLIDRLSIKPQKKFSTTSFTCDCGHQITIELYNGQCPICGKDSPNKRKFATTCSICGHPCLKDQYGNGECENCGWQSERDEEIFEKERGISYPMLVTPTTAREQYKKGLPFKATFEEFVNGLYFYSEMQFEHNDIMYEVYFEHNEKIIFCSSEMQQEYSSREEFENNAHINNKLLKNIWDEIKNPNFMQCR